MVIERRNNLDASCKLQEHCTVLVAWQHLTSWQDTCPLAIALGIIFLSHIGPNREGVRTNASSSPPSTTP